MSYRENDRVPSHRQAGSQNAELRTARILVVDDESDLEILFGQIFRREIRGGEFAFSFVNDGLSALELLEKDHGFDLVLSDIRMPNMDGLTLLNELNKRHPFLKTVMVTAYGDMDNIRKAMNSGAFDFISKPIHYQDLKTTIRKTLQHASDLRELHRAREEKAVAQARLVSELRKLDEMKNEFLANTSHELRTPLHGIIGIVESLLDQVDREHSEKTRRQLGLVLKSGKRLAHLVNDLLDFSALRADALTLETQPLHLTPIVTSVLALLKPLAKSKNLELRHRIPDRIPPVEANDQRLQQILLNLVGNAIKFTDSGSVTVDALVEPPLLRVRVKDTGIGVPKEMRTLIFESFRQGQSGAARGYGGTGLGLSIAQKLVSLHGGTLTLESEVGQGSTFSFSLWISNREVEGESASEEAISKIVVPFDDSPEEELTPLRDIFGEGFRILLVDDDKVNLEVLAESLHQYQLEIARNGEEALRKLGRFGDRYDLVLLDVMMPNISGLEICRKIRAVHAPNTLPVVLITAKNRLQDLVEGLEAGANDFITKPFARKELLARVRTHLELSRLTRSLKQAQAVSLKNARAAGKADFATSVLHNVGNILSSIKVSCTNASLKLTQSKVSGLLMAGALLEANLHRLPEFLTSDPKGRKLPDYFIQLGQILKKENQTINTELESMKKRIGIMEKAIQSQQEEAREEMVPLFLPDLIEESLTVQDSSLTKHGIGVERRFDYRDVVLAHQTVIIQILVNLIKNSIEAMHHSEKRVLTIETGLDEKGLPFCRITDTGVGIEDLAMLFKRGLTTKKDGHGFGLDFCLKAMEAMNGRLHAESPGPGRGASFILGFAAPGG